MRSKEKFCWFMEQHLAIKTAIFLARMIETTMVGRKIAQSEWAADFGIATVRIVI